MKTYSTPNSTCTSFILDTAPLISKVFTEGLQYDRLYGQYFRLVVNCRCLQRHRSPSLLSTCAYSQTHMPMHIIAQGRNSRLFPDDSSLLSFTVLICSAAGVQNHLLRHCFLSAERKPAPDNFLLHRRN